MNVTQTDLINIQEEFFENLSKTQQKLTSDFDQKVLALENTLYKYTNKIDDLSSKINQISNTRTLSVSLEEKVSKLYENRTRVDNTLSQLSSDMNKINNDFNNACYRYDRVIYDSLTVPGLIGPNNKYLSISNYLDYADIQISDLLSYKERNASELTRYKERIEAIITTFNKQIDYSKNTFKEFCNRTSKECDEKCKNFINSVDVHIDSLKLENAQYAIELRKMVHDVNIEHEVLLNIKKDIFERLDNELAKFEESTQKELGTINEYKNDVGVIKAAFGEIKEFIKEAKAKKGYELGGKINNNGGKGLNKSNKSGEIGNETMGDDDKNYVNRSPNMNTNIKVNMKMDMNVNSNACVSGVEAEEKIDNKKNKGGAEDRNFGETNMGQLKKGNRRKENITKKNEDLIDVNVKINDKGNSKKNKNKAENNNYKFNVIQLKPMNGESSNKDSIIKNVNNVSHINKSKNDNSSSKNNDNTSINVTLKENLNKVNEQVEENKDIKKETLPISTEPDTNLKDNNKKIEENIQKENLNIEKNEEQIPINKDKINLENSDSLKDDHLKEPSNIINNHSIRTKISKTKITKEINNNIVSPLHNENNNKNLTRQISSNDAQLNYEDNNLINADSNQYNLVSSSNSIIHSKKKNEKLQDDEYDNKKEYLITNYQDNSIYSPQSNCSKLQRYCLNVNNNQNNLNNMNMNQNYNFNIENNIDLFEQKDNNKRNDNANNNMSTHKKFKSLNILNLDSNNLQVKKIGDKFDKKLKTNYNFKFKNEFYQASNNENFTFTNPLQNKHIKNTIENNNKPLLKENDNLYRVEILKLINDSKNCLKINSPLIKNLEVKIMSSDNKIDLIEKTTNKKLKNITKQIEELLDQIKNIAQKTENKLTNPPYNTYLTSNNPVNYPLNDYSVKSNKKNSSYIKANRKRISHTAYDYYKIKSENNNSKTQEKNNSMLSTFYGQRHNFNLGGNRKNLKLLDGDENNNTNTGLNTVNYSSYGVNTNYGNIKNVPLSVVISNEPKDFDKNKEYSIAVKQNVENFFYGKGDK